MLNSIGLTDSFRFQFVYGSLKTNCSHDCKSHYRQSDYDSYESFTKIKVQGLMSNNSLPSKVLSNGPDQVYFAWVLFGFRPLLSPASPAAPEINLSPIAGRKFLEDI